MRLPHISHIVAYFSKVRISRIFPHKLACSTAISVFYVFFLFEAIFVLIRKWQTICKLNLKKLLQTALNLLNLKVTMLTVGIISVRLRTRALYKYSCLLPYAHFIEYIFPHISAAYFAFIRSAYFKKPRKNGVPIW